MINFEGINRQELMMMCSSLVDTMERLIENIDAPPDPACSCHMGHPPCNDCVEYGALREAISDGRRVIKEARAYEAPDWHQQVVSDGPMHQWFGLTYSSYLVLHRVLMTHMPLGWQQRMVDLLGELGETFDEDKVPQDFFIRARENGKFTTDPFSNYRHFPVNELPWKRFKCPVCQSSEAVFKCSFGAWNCADCGVAFEPDTGKLLEPEEEQEDRNE